MRSQRCVDQLLLSDRRDSTIGIPGKSPFLFLSLSISDPPSRFFSFFPYPPALPSLVCSILISFHFFPFSLIFLFLFSPQFLFCITITHMDQVGETSPHFPPWPLVITMFFFLIFFIFFFPFITSCNTWLNVSHLFQVHHMDLAMCHSLEVPYGIHMIITCVTRPRCLGKREISTISESDEIRRGN